MSYLHLADVIEVPRQQNDGKALDLAGQQQVVPGQMFLLAG